MKRFLLCALTMSLVTAVSRPAASRPEGRNPREPATPQATTQRPVQAPRDRARAATGAAAIRGRVFAADTGQPLRRARVTWSSEPAPQIDTSQQPARVMTDSEGRYEIRGLGPGRYRVTAARSGYVQMEFGARRGGSGTRAVAASSERGVTIELADGQILDNADVRLPRASAITGRILDEYGDPLISAFVGASRQQRVGGRPRLVAFTSDTTDDNGEFRLSGLPPGTYYVIASAPPYLRMSGATSFADLFYPGVPTRDQARPVTVRENQDTPDVTFMLSPIRLARVSGTIVTSRGGVPKTGTFMLTRAADTGITYATSYMMGLSAEGNFTLPSVAPGDCDLVATVQTDAGATEVGSARLSVTGDDISGLVITTGSEGQLTGTVRTDTGGPLPGPSSTTSVSSQFAMSITLPIRIVATAVDTGNDGVLGALVPSSPGSSGSTRPGAVSGDGSFTAPVRPGARVIGIAGLPAGWGLVSITTGDRNVTDVPVDVAPGSSLPLQIIISNRLGEVTGAALDASERPTADYDVVLFPRDRAKWLPGSTLIRTERPNVRGEFRVTAVRPGDYYIAAVDASDEIDSTDPEMLDRLRGSAAEVTVGLADKKNVQLRVTRIGS